MYLRTFSVPLKGDKGFSGPQEFLVLLKDAAVGDRLVRRSGTPEKFLAAMATHWSRGEGRRTTGEGETRLERGGGARKAHFTVWGGERGRGGPRWESTSATPFIAQKHVLCMELSEKLS